MDNRLYKFIVESIFFLKNNSGFEMHIQQKRLFSN